MVSSGTLDERYLNWLYRRIAPEGQRNPVRMYWRLAVQLHTKEFEWFVPNDDNRVADGIDLRSQFVEQEEGGEYDRDWMGLPCSVLEMLIALSLKASFEDDREPFVWFWTFIDNLGMRGFNDAQYSEGLAELVDETMYILINRKYGRDGRGGLFPLQHAMADQRKVEIWYQLSTYIMENSDAF